MTKLKAPKTDPVSLNAALRRLLSLLDTTDAEFPDACWRVASSTGVDYVALADAYDTYCAARDDVAHADWYERVSHACDR